MKILGYSLKKTENFSIIVFSLIIALFMFVGCKEPTTHAYMSLTKQQAHSIQPSDSTAGLQLLIQKCYVCHGPTASHDNRLAPPMTAVKMHYIKSESTKDSFKAAIWNFVSNPSQEEAKMRGAVRRFGVMPKQAFNKEEILQIAAYMFDTNLAEPDWFEDHKKEMQEGKSKGKAKGKSPGNQPHWSYTGETGPQHWAELEKDSECNGSNQSPVNIVNYKTDPNLPPLLIKYADSTHILNVENNGHSIQYNFKAGDYLLLGNQQFNLLQFHFHEPAEHLIDGVRYPLELHLVHQNKQGAYAVLAIMAKEGKSSEPFNFLESYLPLTVGESKLVDTAFDMNLNLPANRAYFTYQGSLTTPPCTQNVSWFIFKEPITVSLAQVEQLKFLMPLNNYRDEQPINNRVILAKN